MLATVVGCWFENAAKLANPSESEHDQQIHQTVNLCRINKQIKLLNVM